MKRYTATIELYVFADDEDDARQDAEFIAEMLRKENDNQALVLDLEETPFGKLKDNNHENKQAINGGTSQK